MSLQPCPFCGSRNLTLENNVLQVFFIECLDCHTYGPAHPRRQSPEQAAEIWNKRAEEA